jgi:Leucine-rich repeat (LRR) protein
LQELRELILDGNQIHQIASSAFYTLTKLEFLSLSRLSELKEIDGSALKGLVALNNLQISHNPKLTSVHRSLLLGEDAAQHHWSYTHVSI